VFPLPPPLGFCLSYCTREHVCLPVAPQESSLYSLCHRVVASAAGDRRRGLTTTDCLWTSRFMSHVVHRRRQHAHVTQRHPAPFVTPSSGRSRSWTLRVRPKGIDMQPCRRYAKSHMSTPFTAVAPHWLMHARYEPSETLPALPPACTRVASVWRVCGMPMTLCGTSCDLSIAQPVIPRVVGRSCSL
jgi:hypothetical protein